jgi:hypothetical protein
VLRALQSSNILVISSYGVKSIQALLILYLIDVVAGPDELNVVLNLLYILGLVLMFDFGLPNVISRAIIKQRMNSQADIFLGYGFKLLLIAVILSILALGLYLIYHSQSKFIPLLCLLVLIRKSWSVFTSILFGYEKVNVFRKTELLLEFLRLSLTVISVLLFADIFALFLAEIISFTIAIAFLYPKVRCLNISINFSDSTLKSQQLKESWRSAFLYLSSYLSFNIMYNYDIIEISLEDENKLFYNLKMFFALKTISQLPITNLLPTIAGYFNRFGKLSLQLIQRTIVLNAAIFISGVTAFYLFKSFDVHFFSRYYLDGYTPLVILICFGELVHGVLSNTIISTGNIPYWWSSSAILVLQVLASSLWDVLSVEFFLAIMAFRPLLLLTQSVYYFLILRHEKIT